MLTAFLADDYGAVAGVVVLQWIGGKGVPIMMKPCPTNHLPKAKHMPQIMNAYVPGVCNFGRDSVRESTSLNAAGITEEQVSA